MKRLLFTLILGLVATACGRSTGPSGNVIHQKQVSALVDISADVNTSIEFDLEDYSLASIHIPSTFDGTVFNVQCAAASGGTYVAAKTSADATCDITTAASQVAGMPSGDCALALSGVRYCVIEATTNQATTDTAILVDLKR